MTRCFSWTLTPSVVSSARHGPPLGFCSLSWLFSFLLLYSLRLIELTHRRPLLVNPELGRNTAGSALCYRGVLVLGDLCVYWRPHQSSACTRSIPRFLLLFCRSIAVWGFALRVSKVSLNVMPSAVCPSRSLPVAPPLEWWC